MTKAAFLITLILIVWSLGRMVANAPAQEVLPDENLLALSCDYAGIYANSNGFDISKCRRVSETVDGNRAIETVSVVMPTGKRISIDIYWMRSYWGSPVITAAAHG
jgi:hypothetical protein